MSPGIELGTSHTEGRALNQLWHPCRFLELKYNNNDDNNYNNNNSQKHVTECNTFIAPACKQPSHAFEHKLRLEIIGILIIIFTCLMTTKVQLVDSLK